MDKNLKNRGMKYIFFSILELIFCWRIPALIALILSIMGLVNTSNGDEIGALNMFGYAKIALWVSFGIEILLIVLGILGIGLIGLGSSIIAGAL